MALSGKETFATELFRCVELCGELSGQGLAELACEWKGGVYAVYRDLLLQTFRVGGEFSRL